jgi:hypothetical protein
VIWEDREEREEVIVECRLRTMTSDNDDDLLSKCCRVFFVGSSCINQVERRNASGGWILRHGVRETHCREKPVTVLMPVFGAEGYATEVGG